MSGEAHCDSQATIAVETASCTGSKSTVAGFVRFIAGSD
jgi:hypothetical protein